MTNKAAKAVTNARYGAGLALLCLLPMVAAAKDGPYLTWGAKATPVQATDAPPPIQTPQVAVPPSPYGQVGDPYRHVLTWSTKPEEAKSGTAAQPVATAAPMRRAPVQQMAPVQASAPVQYAPAPTYQPQRQAPAYRTQAPQYRAQPMASTLPEPVQDEPTQPLTRQPLPAIAAQTPQPVRQPAPPALRQAALVARPAPQAPVSTASPPPSDKGAYQVPTNSPYAARIAAARAAQAKAETRTQPQAAATPPKPVGKAAPAPTVQPSDAPVTETASDDEKPFVPGQHYTDASEAPRLYSLHRAYGLKPDPITVDSDASGAVLDTSRLDAAQAKAEKAEKADEDAAGDDPEADGVSDKTSSSASATQNAPADKTKAAK